MIELILAGVFCLGMIVGALTLNGLIKRYRKALGLNEDYFEN